MCLHFLICNILGKHETEITALKKQQKDATDRIADLEGGSADITASAGIFLNLS